VLKDGSEFTTGGEQPGSNFGVSELLMIICWITTSIDMKLASIDVKLAPFNMNQHQST
jgi:hypothetical protein